MWSASVRGPALSLKKLARPVIKRRVERVVDLLELEGLLDRKRKRFLEISGNESRVPTSVDVKTPGDLIGYSGKLGLDVADFIDALENHAGAPSVAEEVES
jgi:hypothetical protein